MQTKINNSQHLFDLRNVGFHNLHLFVSIKVKFVTKDATNKRLRPPVSKCSQFAISYLMRKWFDDLNIEDRNIKDRNIKDRNIEDRNIED